jgi:hypothetical protein
MLHLSRKIWTWSVGLVRLKLLTKLTVRASMVEQELEARHLEHHPALACSIHTFGKAAVCHGAVICFNQPVFKEIFDQLWIPLYLFYSVAIALNCGYQMCVPKHDGTERAGIAKNSFWTGTFVSISIGTEFAPGNQYFSR